MEKVVFGIRPVIGVRLVILNSVMFYIYIYIYIYSPHLHRAYNLMFKAEINQNMYLLIVQGELRVVYENTVQSKLI